MVRQMLGAVNEFVAASARERLAHGRAKALSEIASDPIGARSAQGDPKLGAPTALLESDPQAYGDNEDLCRHARREEAYLQSNREGTQEAEQKVGSAKEG